MQTELEEMQILRDFIQWNSAEAFSPEKVKKVRLQSIISALICWAIAVGIFLYQPVDKIHIISIALLVIGVVQMYPGSIYGNGSHAYKYTSKYLDLELAKERLKELEEINNEG